MTALGVRRLLAFSITFALATSLGLLAKPALEIVPEYAKAETVVLPAAIFDADYRAGELLKAILDADANVLIAAPSEATRSVAAKLVDKLPLPEQQRARIKVAVLPHDDMWLRDFGPLIAREKPKRPGLRGALVFVDALYDGDSSQNERFPVTLASRLGSKTTTLPVYLDGGNLLAAGRLCLSSAADILPLGAQATGNAAGVRMLQGPLAKALGCDEHATLAEPPHEHLDMFVKAVADDTVMVSELDHATLTLATAVNGGQAPNELVLLKKNLDAQAAQLAARLKVVRVPMPLPYRGGFRTYTNSLLVNGTAIIPSYERYGWGYDSYPDERLKNYYETKVRSVYTSLGFNVTFVNADGLIYNGGAFHCIALQIPEGTRSL